MDENITERIRNEIIMHVKRRRIIGYDMISLVIGQSNMDVEKIEDYLESIVRTDYREDKPILWSAVVDSAGKPSESYFSLLEELGIVPGNSIDQEKNRIHKRLMEEAFVYWSSRRRSGKKRFKPRY